MRNLVAVKFKCENPAHNSDVILTQLLWERVGDPTVTHDEHTTLLVAQREDQHLIVTAQLAEGEPALVRVCCVVDGVPKDAWPTLMAWGEILARALATIVEAYWYEVVELRETGAVTVHDAEIKGSVIEHDVCPPAKVSVGAGGMRQRKVRDC